MINTPIPRPQQNKNEWWIFIILISGLTAFYFWYGWSWVPIIVQDQGLFLQVASRVAQGDVLYRDVLWCYGPLPILLMSGLMRLGRSDIVYYSIMNIVLATGSTIILYFLHRLVFGTRNAVIATLVVVFGLGTYQIFLRSYTPGIAFGVFGALATFLGTLLALNNPRNYMAIVLIAVGIVTSVLSKLEFAAATLGLVVLVLVALWRIAIDHSDHVRAAKTIFIGLGVGLGIAGIVYGILAIMAGWANVWTGATGYELFRYIHDEQMGYHGLIDWAKIAAASLWLVVAGVASVPINRKIRIATILMLAVFYLILFAAIQGDWLTQVRDNQASLFDVSFFLTSAASVAVDGWYVWFQSQVNLVVSVGIVLLSLLWMVRWLVRWYHGETASLQQWIAVMTVAYMQLVDLRFFFTGGSFPLFGIFLLAAMAGHEFPSWHFKRWNTQAILLTGLLIAFSIFELLKGLVYVTAGNPAPFSTRYGSAVLYRPTREFVVQVLHYIDDNTQSDSTIAVLGPFTGIYYLSGRVNPFRQDYQMAGMGENEYEAQDFIDRLDRFAPPILLVPQGDWGMGILSVRPISMNSGWIKWTGQPAFRSEAARVEKYILDHYQFDQILGTPDSWQMAAFKRIY